MSKHFEMLPEEAFQKDPFGNIKLYKKGGGGGPTNTTVNQTNIPEYAQGYVETMLGAAQQQLFNGTTDAQGNFNITGFNEFTPYSTDMNDYVAGFSPMQRQAFQGAANLQTPGQYGEATTLAGASGLGSLGMAGELANTGYNFARQATDPNAVRAYMNPFLESALNPQMDAMRRQYGITGAEQQSKATGAGAFGGSREALMAAENYRNMNSAIDSTLAKGYYDAFNNAQQQQQFGANLGLQGNQAALQGLGQGIQAANTLGQLGTQQLGAEKDILGLQQQYGAMQREAEQQKIDQSIQNYAMQQQAPMQSLAQMSGLLRGLPLEATTTQSYQQAPGALQSLAGIGTGIAGVASLARAKGGTVKSYAGGGIVGYAGGGDVMSQDNAEGIAQGLNAEQLQQVQPRTLPDYIRIPLLNQKVQEQQAAQQAMAAQQGMADQESIKQQILAQAEDLGITGAQSNLPDEAMMAGGGIVSFATGGINAPKFNYTPDAMDYGYLDKMAESLNNPLTGMPYTYEEKVAERIAREKAAGIKDLTEDQLKALKAKEDKLGARESRAQGLGLLAASEGIMNAKGPGLGWLGAGLGAYGKTTGAELEKIDMLRENYAQQGDLIRTKQMDMKRAEVTGDTATFDRARKELNELTGKKGEAANTNIAAKNAARLKGTEAEYKYAQDMALADKEGAYKVAAGAASNIGVVQLPKSLYDMISGRDAQFDALKKQFDASRLGQAYQTALTNRAQTGKDSSQDANIIADAEKELAKIRGDVNRTYGPSIRNQIKQARAYGHSISEKEEADILKGIIPVPTGNTGGEYGDLSKYEKDR